MEKPKLRVIAFALTVAFFCFSWTSYGADYDVHTVVKGDTLYSLAKSCGISVDELIAFNGLGNIDIKIGDVIKLPHSGETEKPGGAEFAISVPTITVALSIPLVTEKDRPAPKDSSILEPASTMPITLLPAVSNEPMPEFADRPQRLYSVTKEEYDLLAKLVYAESRGEPIEGQIAVAAVVLNRVKHPSFPDTVKEVILEPGQFMSVENGMINLEAGHEARRAVDLALQGQDPSSGALFFYNPRKSRALAWWQTRITTAVIGDHNFAI